VCLRGGQNVKDDKDGDPDLVDEEEGQEGSEEHHRRENLVDEEEHDGGADGKRKRADSRHAYENLQDELMGAGDAVRVFQVEELERLQEETELLITAGKGKGREIGRCQIEDWKVGRKGGKGGEKGEDDQSLTENKTEDNVHNGEVDDGEGSLSERSSRF